MRSEHEYPVEHRFDTQAILIREDLIADLKEKIAELETGLTEAMEVIRQNAGTISALRAENADLGAQVAALKKIAEDERAYILSANVVESTGVDEFLRTEARRQLTEKYPEAFK